ncbi:hypothetical protein BS78_01G240500 [Paspalum vaginatum]|nr:hypothetical protein BS78_01G240500 [Paspalum vaginatum]
MAFAASGVQPHVAVDVEGEVERRAREEAETDGLWAAIDGLPSPKRRNLAIVLPDPDSGGGGARKGKVVDVRRLDRREVERVLRRAFATADLDNANLLHGIKARFDAVGLEVPRVELRFRNLTVSTEVHVGSRALPTLVNYIHDIAERLLISCHVLRPNKRKLTILDDVSGVVKPGRMTLLLGPPSSGKSTLLLALAGKLDPQLKKSGQVTYNGTSLHEFCVQRTYAYISQTDNHIGELTVRETLDFAAQCQGASENWQECLKELHDLERKRQIRSTPEIDAFMKTASVGGQKYNLVTDYVLRVLGLDLCADTPVGTDMARGVSGGQKKRVTTGEMIVGPRKTLLMDEISTGLDSSTTYQIVKCMRDFVHEMEATVLMSLLQPAPETFDLFDDVILLSEGHMIYQGPTVHVVDYFKSLGFSLLPRKGIADFLQEVTSRKDQVQYWSDMSKQYSFISASTMASAFKQSQHGLSLDSILLDSYDGPNSPHALARSKFAVSKLSLVRACFARELILISRNRFLYTFRTCQVAFVGVITCTIFLRTRVQPVDEQNGNLYLSCLFYGLVHMLFNETIPFILHAFSIPNWILRIPYSLIEAAVWSCVVYYTVGFAPTADRFFRFMLLLFSVHQMALGLFRVMGAIARDMTIANTFGSAAVLAIFLLGGFIVPKEAIKPWWQWAYWLSPLMYGQRAISVNEFSAPRWSKLPVATGSNTVGANVLISHNLPTQDYWCWIGVCALLAYAVLFNGLFTLALAFLNPLQKAHVIIPYNSEEKKNAGTGSVSDGHVFAATKMNCIAKSCGRNYEVKGQTGAEVNKGMILPFLPLTMTFHDVNYFVDMQEKMKATGVPEKRLQLLFEVSGVFRPRVLTALVGSSGAGKTTLLDVLAGRKTGGYIKGDIRISGHKKEQRTFARISGYVEQNDIHSPQVTVEESLWFSSILRLPKNIRETRHEVMALVELDQLRHALVGKEAAIVMRAVRNTVDTGRTVVCTIHQPSIDIFEAFDELLLLKRGGRVIYGGSLGLNSIDMIAYFQTRMPFILSPTNRWSHIGENLSAVWPAHGATWRPAGGGTQHPRRDPPAAARIEVLSRPITKIGTKLCGHDGVLVPELVRLRKLGKTTEDLMLVMGSLYAASLFLGVNNASSVQPVVSTERTVYYRERAARMYSSFPYAAAQGLVEIPYIVAQTLIFGLITYFMINYERNIEKLLLYLVFMFLTFTYFTFYGMVAVGLTPTQQMAAVVSSAFYSLWNLLSGFLIPQSRIPGWWIWFYYICPVAWTLRGIITSQLGDVQTRIVGPGFDGTVQEFLEESLGFGEGMGGVTVAVLLGFSLFFFAIYATSIKVINFQRR